MDRNPHPARRLVAAAAAVLTTLTIFAFVHELAAPPVEATRIAAAAPSVR